MADILRVPHKIRRYPLVHAQPHRAMHHQQRKFPLAGVYAHPAWPHLGTYEFAATGPCAPPSPPPSLAAKQTDFQPDLALRKVRFLFIGGTTRHILNEDVTRKDTMQIRLLLGRRK